jgi:hypothetical protein
MQRSCVISISRGFVSSSLCQMDLPSSESGLGGRSFQARLPTGSSEAILRGGLQAKELLSLLRPNGVILCFPSSTEDESLKATKTPLALGCILTPRRISRPLEVSWGMEAA